MFEGFYQGEYWFSRFIIQRGLGIIYLIAFLVALNQFLPLLGENGLLPAPRFLQRVSFRKSPSIFQWYYSDRFFTFVAATGLLLSLVVISGISETGPLWFSMFVWFMLWALYLSIVNIGQLFYGFGWESILLEAGFYAIFLGPMHYVVPAAVIFILRWLVFRIEFGAGLIKLRGDSCWRDLTCLNYHHETQPMPNPLSRYFHLLPESVHKLETFFNHAVQLGFIWLLFFPQPIASIAAVMIILSQLYLVISGNYAWLNWITILLAMSGVSDRFFQMLVPFSAPADLSQPLFYQFIIGGVTLMVIYLSIGPARNLLSRKQRMNVSFNPLHLVNTYGAFGSVTRKRYEIVIEGTRDEQISPETEWKAYEFKGKPGNPNRIPPLFAPYHLRLDWQIWFAAMTSIQHNPWLVRFVLKLLKGDKSTLELLRDNPFKDKPPNYIRARLFRYEFTTFPERKKSGQWWKRDFQQMYLSPRSLEDLERIRF